MMSTATAFDQRVRHAWLGAPDAPGDERQRRGAYNGRDEPRRYLISEPLDGRA